MAPPARGSGPLPRTGGGGDPGGDGGGGGRKNWSFPPLTLPLYTGGRRRERGGEYRKKKNPSIFQSFFFRGECWTPCPGGRRGLACCLRLLGPRLLHRPPALPRWGGDRKAAVLLGALGPVGSHGKFHGERGDSAQNPRTPSNPPHASCRGLLRAGGRAHFGWDGPRWGAGGQRGQWVARLRRPLRGGRDVLPSKTPGSCRQKIGHNRPPPSTKRWMKQNKGRGETKPSQGWLVGGRRSSLGDALGAYFNCLTGRDGRWG